MCRQQLHNYAYILIEPHNVTSNTKALNRARETARAHLKSSEIQLPTAQLGGIHRRWNVLARMAAAILQRSLIWQAM